MTEEIMQESMYIGGEWRGSSGGETHTLYNPATGEKLAVIPYASKEDADLAIQTARAALKEDSWKRMDPSKRGLILRSLAKLTYDHAKELALIESKNNGKTFRDALGDVRFAAATLDYYAGWCDKIEGRTIPVPGERLDYTLRQPLGSTLHIIPWNFPLQLAIRSIAPALAAGCTVIAKPASLTPLSLLRWARYAEEAGIPPGVLQVITGSGSKIGDYMVRSPEIDGISVTGSVETGASVMKAAAENITPVTLELGGKGANIVLPDANLKRAAKGVCFGIFWNAGQMCWAGARLIAHEEIASELVDLVKDEVAKWKIGPGTEEGVRIGSLVSQDQREIVLNYVRKGIDSGAKLVVGGGPPQDESLKNGAFLEPTILADVDPNNVVAKEEIFGPVLSVIPFSDLDEAIKIANDTDFGLLNGIWTSNLRNAHLFAGELESGMVSINEYPVTFPQTPFIGWKKSGIGAEQGELALQFYSRTKNVNVNFSL